jgi:hypothetical protein
MTAVNLTKPTLRVTAERNALEKVISPPTAPGPRRFKKNRDPADHNRPQSRHRVLRERVRKSHNQTSVIPDHLSVHAGIIRQTSVLSLTNDRFRKNLTDFVEKD